MSVVPAADVAGLLGEVLLLVPVHDLDWVAAALRDDLGEHGAAVWALRGVSGTALDAGQAE